MIKAICTLKGKVLIETLLEYVQSKDVLDLNELYLTIFKDTETNQRTVLVLDNRWPEDILSELFGNAKVDCETFWDLRDVLFGMNHSRKFKKRIKRLVKLSNQKHEKWRRQ